MLSDFFYMFIFIFIVVFGTIIATYILRSLLVMKKEKVNFFEAAEIVALKDGREPSENWIRPRDREREGKVNLPLTIEEELKNKLRNKEE